MSFSLRSAVWTVAIPAVLAFAPRDVPTQTVGLGLPIHELMPTEAPSMELVKKNLEKKALTNICTEWSLAGGGQPECFYSETCLFTTASGYLIEGCAQTSIRYNWVTTCYDYPQVGTGVSDIYCPSSAPSCGIYAFVFSAGQTFYNYGCSSTAYVSFAYLISGGAASSTSILASASSITPIPVPRPTTDTAQPAPNPTTPPTPTSPITTASVNPGPRQSSTSFSDSGLFGQTSTPLPNPTPHPPKKAPIGAIVGGVIGGIAVIALLAFLAWFFLRKRRQDREAATAHEIQVQHNQANAANAATATAFHNNQHVSEIHGKPAIAGVAAAGAYGAATNEKPALAANTQEYYQPNQPPYNPNMYAAPTAYGGGVDPHNDSQSPPPMYGHPPPPSNPSYPASPHSGYSELDPAGRPVSMMTPPPISPAVTGTGSANELAGTMQGTGGPQRGSVSEMSASAGVLGRRPVGGQPAGGPRMDMSGNPMSEDYHQHELE